MSLESSKSIFVRASTIVVLFAFAPAHSSKAEQQNTGGGAGQVPRFQDYLVNEVFGGPAAPLKIPRTAGSDVRAKLPENSSRKPNFAGHYEFVTWGCGTNCTAGAVVDLKTGDVYSPPLTERTEWLPEYRGWGICAQSWDGPWEVRVDSRLMMISCGWNYDAQGKNWPDVYYLVWQENRFREVLHVRPPKK
jgi:hypothetical protein